MGRARCPHRAARGIGKACRTCERLTLARCFRTGTGQRRPTAAPPAAAFDDCQRRPPMISFPHEQGTQPPPAGKPRADKHGVSAAEYLLGHSCTTMTSQAQRHLFEIPVKVGRGPSCPMPPHLIGALVVCYAPAEDHLAALRATIAKLQRD